MIALIDSDLVAFRCSASAENDGEYSALLRCEELMMNILQATQADSYKAFLTGGNNFRKEINPEYKANRKDKPLPTYLNACREYLVTEWKAQVTDGYEADDALGFWQTLLRKERLDGFSFNALLKEEGKNLIESNGEPSVICSLDKDMLQIPGKHYQWPLYNREGMFHEISELDGLKHFYRQMLIGDISDNIKGVDGIGKVKAAKLIDPLETEEEMFEVVQERYDSIDRFNMNCNLLWIWRKEGEKFSDRDIDY